MGVNITCDCCQKPTEKATEVGYVKTAYYCDACLVFYNEYKKEIDDFHDEIAKQVKEGIIKVRSDWLLKHPDAILPDKHNPECFEE